MKKYISCLLCAVMLIIFLPSGVLVSGASRDVYVTPSGEKYHSKESCSGLNNASKIITISEDTAKSRGYEKCSRCWNNSGKSTTTSAKDEQKEAKKGIKITSVKVSKDGTSITFRIKNKTKKKIIVDPRCFVADKMDEGFAWHDVDMKIVTIKCGKSKTLKYVAYPGNDDDDYPTSDKVVKYDSKTMGGMIYIVYKNIWYAYIYNPITGTNTLKKWDDDSMYYE